KEAFAEIIKHKVSSHDYSVKIESGSSKGDNYIGVVYRAIVESPKDAKDNEKRDNFSVIVKVPPQNPIRRKQFFARPCFLREALAYDEILPILKEFQSIRNIKMEDTFYEYPECYKTLTEDYHEAVFLRDLRMDKFFMLNRFEEITIDYVLLVVRI
uniref:Uncharacterized protein n=1 Tax=Megaselia scalaris TaxID=36166 RepID=T1GYE2_MEGSC